MNVSYSRTFKKMFQNQPISVQRRFGQRLALLISDGRHPLLKMHALTGQWRGCVSINITGDVRAVFEYVSNRHVEFVAIGSHSELYE